MKIEYYLPENVLTNEELSRLFSDFEPSKIETKLGIRERHISDVNETALDLAFHASRKALEGYNRDQIDFILLCTQSPDYFLPTSACILQEKLGLKTNIGALDFNLGCSGFIYGLSMAKGLIKAEIAQNILLVTAETYSKDIHPKDRSNRSIFGDAAAATIINADDVTKIFKFELGTDGGGKENLILKNGGFRNKYETNFYDWNSETENIGSGNFLYMNGPEIFNFTIENIPYVVDNVLRKNSLTLDAIDYVIFHQANKYMLEYLRKKIKIPSEKFYINMLNTGNTVSATIPIALKDCLNNNIIHAGQKVLLVGFGVGYSWGATIIEI